MISNHLETERMFAFIDGELPSAEEAAFRQHLAVCPDCQSRLAGVMRLFGDIESLPELPLQRDLSAAVITELSSRQDSIQDLPWWLVLQGAAAAGVLASWLALQPGRMPALAGIFDQIDLFVWWGRWVMPRLSDLRIALATIPDQLSGWLAIADAPQVWNPLSGLPWVLVIAGSILLWLIGNGLLLDEGPAQGIPWRRDRMRKDSNHG